MVERAEQGMAVLHRVAMVDLVGLGIPAVLTDALLLGTLAVTQFDPPGIRVQPALGVAVCLELIRMDGAALLCGWDDPSTGSTGSDHYP